MLVLITLYIFKQWHLENMSHLPDLISFRVRLGLPVIMVFSRSLLQVSVLPFITSKVPCPAAESILTTYFRESCCLSTRVQNTSLKNVYRDINKIDKKGVVRLHPEPYLKKHENWKPEEREKVETARVSMRKNRYKNSNIAPQAKNVKERKRLNGSQCHVEGLLYGTIRLR